MADLATITTSLHDAEGGKVRHTGLEREEQVCVCGGGGQRGGNVYRHVV